MPVPPEADYTEDNGKTHLKHLKLTHIYQPIFSDNKEKHATGQVFCNYGSLKKERRNFTKTCCKNIFCFIYSHLLIFGVVFGTQ